MARPNPIAVVRAVGWVTFLEVVRDKVLYNILVFAFLLLGVGLLASKLSFVRQDRIVLDFGMTAVHLSCVMVAIFTGAGVIGREFERRTFFVALSRPISRFEFIVGKFAGLALVQVANWALLASAYLLILRLVGADFGIMMSSSLFWGILLVLPEALVMCAAALMFSTLSTTSLSAMITVGLYLVGSNVSQIRMVAARTKDHLSSGALDVLANVLPNLENFNLGFKVTYSLPTPTMYALGNFAYGLLFAAYLVTLAGILIQSRGKLMIFDWILVGWLGLVIGSFLNVVIHRVPKRQSIVFPASRCPKCKKHIAWYDNVPVISYAILRGRCRKCRTKISPRYPLVELVTCVLFLAARVTHGLSIGLFVRDFPLLAILVAVTFIDLDHRIIPNVLSLPGTALALLTSFLDLHLGLEPLLTFGLFVPPESAALTAALRSFEGGCLGYGLFYGLARSYELATGRAGLGGGDVKLLALIGAFLGPYGVLITILVSSVLGSVVGITWALVTRKKNMMSAAIPYGPFLVVGALYYYLFY